MRDTDSAPSSNDETRQLTTDAIRSTTPSDDIISSSLSPPNREANSEHLQLLEPDRKLSANKSGSITPDSAGNSKSSKMDASRVNKLLTWWKESVLLLAALGLLIAIVSILAAYGGKPLPKWTLGLNLNTVVALLATALRSSLVMVLEEVLSQAKWMWQHRIHPIIDLAAFDDASRGPLGSLLLWFKVNLSSRESFLARHVSSAFLASVVTALSLAIGSFTQQAVKSIPCDIALHNSSASLLLAGGPMDSMTIPMGKKYDLDASTKGRLNRAVTGTVEERSAFVHGCTTGSCTFPEVAPGVTHITSGFCSKCLNITNSVLEVPGFGADGFANTSSASQLPSGLLVGYNGALSASVGDKFYWDTADMTNASWSDKNMYNHTEFFEAWKVSVGKVDVIMTTTAGCKWSAFDGEADDYASGAVIYNYDCSYPSERDPFGGAKQFSWNVVSASCILYPCVKELRARVENGRFKEEVVKETPVYQFDPTTQYITIMVKTPCFIDGIQYDRHNLSLVPALGGLIGSERARRKCFYSIPYIVGRSVVEDTWFKDLFSGNCTVSAAGRSSTNCSSDPVDKWWLSSLYNKSNATFDTVAATMNDVATALTDSMRLASLANDGLNFDNTVNGTVWQVTVCTEFDWRWLMFPMALIALSIASLVLMIVSTAFANDYIPVWKSSILPFLYLGNSKMHTMSLEEMEKAAKQDKVALRRNDTGGWQLIPGHKERDDASG